MSISQNSDMSNTSSLSFIEKINGAPMTSLKKAGAYCLTLLVVGVCAATIVMPFYTGKKAIEVAEITKATKIAELDAILVDSQLYKNLLQEIQYLKNHINPL